jgi:hypothetical protein
MNKTAVHLAAVLVMMACSTQVWATPLAPGTTVTPGFQSTSGFVVLSDTGAQPFNLGDGTTGTLDAQVGTLSTNPIPGGGLTFIYQVTVSSGLVEHVSGSSFANFTADVAFDDSAPGTVRPMTVDRGPTGRVIEFNGEWIQGQTSAILIVNTDAKNFTSGTIGIIDGGGATLVGFSPLANVSGANLSPAAWLLLHRPGRRRSLATLPAWLSVDFFVRPGKLLPRPFFPLPFHSCLKFTHFGLTSVLLPSSRNELPM